MTTVAIDARWIGPTPSGVGVYTLELLRRLPRLAPDWHFHLLFASEKLRLQTLENGNLGACVNVTAEVLDYGIFAPAGQLRLPRRLRQLGATLFHTTNYLMPYLAFPRGGAAGACGRCVATIHDVIPLLLRDHAPRSRKSRLLPLFRLCLRQSLLRSGAVITVSETARRDLLAALGADATTARRVQVVYNGVDERFQPAPHPEGLPCRTLLYVGRLDPYKNVVTLIRAFAQLRHAGLTETRLLIAGPDDPRYPEARRAAANLGLDDAVRFLGYVSHEDLIAAYQRADLLVNPSRYEGFGIPLIEAMRCGVPVVCCDGGAQAEVVGKAALVVPPGDTQALAEAMRRVLLDEPLRRHLTAAGLARAAHFSWDRAAEQTLAVYRRLLSPAAGGAA